jgi:Transposase IS116/IS110/IS902 family
VEESDCADEYRVECARNGLASVTPCPTRLARDLLADLPRLDTTIKASTKSLTTAPDTAGSPLTDVHGLAPVLAARILAHSGDSTRFPSRHHYASYCGTRSAKPRVPGPGRNHYYNDVYCGVSWRLPARELSRSKPPAATNDASDFSANSRIQNPRRGQPQPHRGT